MDTTAALVVFGAVVWLFFVLLYLAGNEHPPRER